MLSQSNIVVLSANCQGLRTLEKRIDVLSYMKETGASIVCLQDTHLTEREINSVKQIWPDCYLHGQRNNSQGVAILFNNNFEYTVNDVQKDDHGNWLKLKLTVGGFNINLITIYAPNQDNPSFFETIREIAEHCDTEYTVICGDFNLVLDPQKDCNNYTNVNNPRSRQKVLDLISELDLIDIYRHFHPNHKRYTWRKKNPIKQARLDYFLTNRYMMDIIEKCSIQPGYHSDHSIVEMQIALNNFKQGKGLWKFNNSLLQNNEYLNLVNRLIKEEKLNYALPVYNFDFLENNDNIQMTIDNDLFLEVLLLKIRGETVKFASKLKRQTSQTETKLLEDIKTLENLETNQFTLKHLEDKQVELENIRRQKIKGYMTRTRLQWLGEGERPTSFFCNLEKKNFVEKTIKKLQLHNGHILTNQTEILEEIRKFYTDLFKNCDQKEKIHIPPQISSKVTKILSPGIGREIEIEELTDALKNTKNNKSPGIDGFPADFLKVFWSKLKVYVLNALNTCYQKGKLSVSLRQSVITCLPKGNKDRKLIQNWRPISLLSAVYKLASTVIANRLKPHLEDIISKSQSGFIKGRRIEEGTRLVYDIMSYTEKLKIPGLLMLIDFQKAFDSVSWDFLYMVLKTYGLDENFIDWIKLFNNDITAYVNQCGFLSKPIYIERGCRQGDPISPYLFILVAEILNIMIEQNSDIKGIPVGHKEIKLTQFADDTTIILDGCTESLQAALNTLEIFGSLSGLRVNKEKTKLVWIGSKKYSREKLNVTQEMLWGEEDFSLLGIDFSINLNRIPTKNFKKVLQKAKVVINSWKYRINPNGENNPSENNDPAKIHSPFLINSNT